jgi:hypothetical protein
MSPCRQSCLPTPYPCRSRRGLPPGEPALCRNARSGLPHDHGDAGAALVISAPALPPTSWGRPCSSSADMLGTTYTFLARCHPHRPQRAGPHPSCSVTLEGSDLRTVNGDNDAGGGGRHFASSTCRVPMQSETQHCRNLTLALPRHLLFGTEVQNEALHGLLLKRSTSTARLIGSHLRALFADLPGYHAGRGASRSSPPRRISSPTLVGPTDCRAPACPPAVRGAVIMEIRRYIEQHLATAGSRAGPSVQDVRPVARLAVPAVRADRRRDRSISAPAGLRAAFDMLADDRKRGGRRDRLCLRLRRHVRLFARLPPPVQHESRARCARWAIAGRSPSAPPKSSRPPRCMTGCASSAPSDRFVEDAQRSGTSNTWNHPISVILPFDT